MNLLDYLCKKVNKNTIVKYLQNHYHMIKTRKLANKKILSEQ